MLKNCTRRALQESPSKCSVDCQICMKQRINEMLSSGFLVRSKGRLLKALMLHWKEAQLQRVTVASGSASAQVLNHFSRTVYFSMRISLFNATVTLLAPANPGEFAAHTEYW